jgi:hypothetical protein
MPAGDAGCLQIARSFPGKIIISKECNGVFSPVQSGTRIAIILEPDTDQNDFMNTVEIHSGYHNLTNGFPVPVADWCDGPSFTVRVRNGSFYPVGLSQSERSNYRERNFDFFKYRSSGGLVRYRRMRWRGHMVG